MTKLSGAILTLVFSHRRRAGAGTTTAVLPGNSQWDVCELGNRFLGGASVVSVGKVTYDGQGNGQSTGTRSVAGVISRSVAVPGVYTVNPDCTGSKIFGGATNYDFVVTPDGREITWIVTNA